MLKSLVSLIVVISFISLVSCGGGSSKQPSDIIKSFADHIENADYDAVIDLIDTGDEEIDEESKAKLVGLLSMGKGEIDKKDGISSLEVVSEEIEEDGMKAEVVVKYVYGNGEESEEDYKLVKVDGDWKISMK